MMQTTRFVWLQLGSFLFFFFSAKYLIFTKTVQKVSSAEIHKYISLFVVLRRKMQNPYSFLKESKCIETLFAFLHYCHILKKNMAV